MRCSEVGLLAGAVALKRRAIASSGTVPEGISLVMHKYLLCFYSLLIPLKGYVCVGADPRLIETCVSWL